MPKKRTSSSLEGGASVSLRRSTRVSLGSSSAEKPGTKTKTDKKAKSVTSKAAKTSKVKSTTEQADENSLSALSDSPEDGASGISSAPPSKKTKLHKLTVGDKLTDDITLVNEEGEQVKVIELIKEKGAVIFLYPKANTPGCTTQACGFRDIFHQIEEAGFQVFGLSMDSPKSQKNWKEKQKLPYHLLCDPKQHLIGPIGGSKSAEKVQRSHYIFEAGGKILNITSPASTKTSPTDALDFIKSIAKAN